MNNIILQQQICAEHKVPFVECPLELKIGVSKNIGEDILPLNGLRHLIEKGTCGWYIWRGGEIPQDGAHFFEPIHVTHLSEVCPKAMKYLGLPPGWRFYIDSQGFEDVWYDEKLILSGTTQTKI